MTSLLRTGAWPSGSLLRQYVERIVFAGLLAGAALILAKPGGDPFPPVSALLAVIAFASLVALVTTALLIVSPLDFENPYLDMAWRIGTTGLQAFAGALAASAVTDVISFQWSLTWGIVARAMLLSFVKAAAALLNRDAVGASPLLAKRHNLERFALGGFTSSGGGGGGEYRAGAAQALGDALRARDAERRE